MKRTLSIILAIVFALSCCFALAACGKESEGTGSGDNGDAAALKIGAILVGDETEGYTKAHMDGIKAAAKELGIADDQIIWKYKIEETDAVTEAGKQLIRVVHVGVELETHVLHRHHERLAAIPPLAVRREFGQLDVVVYYRRRRALHGPPLADAQVRARVNLRQADKQVVRMCGNLV